MPCGVRAARHRGMRAPRDRGRARRLGRYFEIPAAQGTNAAAYVACDAGRGVRTALMTTCQDIQPRLSEFADGGVAAADRAAIDAHLATCAACRGLLSDLQHI